MGQGRLLALEVLSIEANTASNLDYDTVIKEFTKSKFELSPIDITCELDDIIIITAPVVNCQEVIYYLHKPTGEPTKLDFIIQKRNSTIYNASHHYQKYEFWDSNEIIIKYITKNIKAIYPKSNYRVINANFGIKQSVKDFIVEDAVNNMKKNDFMIGPLFEEDHGNWVLSIYCKDVDDEWIELFQVITIRIIMSVPMKQAKITLEEGSTFDLSFAYPITGLQTCELTAPSSTFDRYFDRSQIDLDKCGYVVTNVTKHDEGIWTVIGVGRMVYEGRVKLSVSISHKIS